MHKGTEYKKYWVVLPNKLVDKLGWKSGEELEADIRDDKIVIEKD